MLRQYPTRNEARGILLKLIPIAKQNSISKIDLTSFCIYFYKKKFGYDIVTFEFTNALIDMFSDMDVEDENTIDMKTIGDIVPGRFSTTIDASIIDDFFKNLTGGVFENWYDKSNSANFQYVIQMSSPTVNSFNIQWFNNSDKFIPPLLSAYQKLKRQRGMMFQRVDILQIPVDYSVILCYNHFKQVGFLNEYVVTQIVRVLTNAANDCLNLEHLKEDEVKKIVMRDLQNPNSVEAAYEFIKQF
jgi:hypothetical protein